MKKIKDFLRKGWERLVKKPIRWTLSITVSDLLRKGLPILALTALLFASHYYTFSEGRSVGKAEGSCALACNVLGAEYGYRAPQDEGGCWCKSGDVEYFSLTIPELD